MPVLHAVSTSLFVKPSCYLHQRKPLNSSVIKSYKATAMYSWVLIVHNYND